VLLKDLVIPAGTVLSPAPKEIKMDESHYECTLGLSTNTHGILIYCVDPEYVEELSEHIADLKE